MRILGGVSEREREREKERLHSCDEVFERNIVFTRLNDICVRISVCVSGSIWEFYVHVAVIDICSE